MEKWTFDNFRPTQGEKLWTERKKMNTFYREYIPCEELQEYVVCYWVSKTINISGESISSRVIPDGCMDMVFNMKEIREGKSGVISGIMTRASEEENKEINEFIGVRFWPGGIIPFIKSSAGDFTNQLVSLDNILGIMSLELNEKLHLASSVIERLTIVEQELKEILLKAKTRDVIIIKAINSIYKKRGVQSVKELSKELNISQRQLSRKFNDWIGISPKKFLNIIKFQHVVLTFNNNEDVDIQRLILEAGYYDQAHFIKEFKAFYGKTPGRL
ncbi:helix-turn-helix domain-containing protein [Sporosalibacterium faouarense]|uniref:helix-turn-helix domain-containing protein n=1 Tax=Sporosalibacterium faouarense TaxID=516123 RepID=UPI00141CB93C|nr:helix-turn-helix domain-containing protein [Sporosalibacterium faouarense]MTI46302.1 AraC family transcriptional regulator [Bacillota bacterium]